MKKYTKEEAMTELNLSNTAITAHFKRTQEKLREQDIILEKHGRGSQATYTITYLAPADGRAEIIEDEITDLIFNEEDISLSTPPFLCLLVALSTPFLGFRGTGTDFLNYVGLPVTAYNKKMVREGLQHLSDSGYFFRGLGIEEVPGKESIYHATLIHDKTQLLAAPRGLVEGCKQVAKLHDLNWVLVLKTYMGLKIVDKEQPFLAYKLIEYTGMSAGMLRRTIKALKSTNFIESELDRRMIQGEHICNGRTVNFNAWLPELEEELRKPR